jgi:predicted extracellular nuclease
MTISSATGSYNITDSTATVNIIDDESTPIHTIQGLGTAAIPGIYTVEAIVTGVYPTLSPAGFYIQEEDADADANSNTSEGIFVVSNTAVNVGDKIRVSGTAIENASSPSFQQAVLNNTTVTVISQNNPMPTVANITLPVSALIDFEKYECMLVRFTDTLTVTDNYNLGRYGEINLSKGGMAFQPTQIVDPNDAVASGNAASGASNVAAVDALALSNTLRTILLDDGRGTIPTLPFVNSDNTLRLGSTTHNITGILGYAFSKYRIQPITATPPTFNYASRPSVPSVGSAANVKVASFNVLNYFNGDGTGGGYPTARGAHSAAEFTRQRDKIISAIAAINADVVGLIEMENDGTGANSAVQDLVNGLNAVMGTGMYSIVNDGATTQTYCTDAIRCAIIYKSTVVSPVGTAMIGSDTVFNRPPLAQTFSVTSSGINFNYIINHFKSKGCSGSSGADADLLDGQACYNQRRKFQAGALMNFISTTVIPTSGTQRILSMGDYNAYYQEDPLDSFRAGGYTVLGADTSYSYLFSGLVGSLDNAIVNDSMRSKVTGIAKWNINSAEPVFLDYNDAIDDGGNDFVNQWASTYTATPFKSSDHDPVIVGLNLTNSVGVENIEALAFNVYPNPATNMIYIGNGNSTSAKWQLYNTVGQQVASGDINVGQRVASVNVTALATGVYVLRIAGADGHVATRQIIKR